MAEGAFHLVAQRWLDFKHKEWADETYRKAEFVVREYLTVDLHGILTHGIGYRRFWAPCAAHFEQIVS
ncbi:hypothetical protein PQR25_24070 [Paraburkholderia nemoris]